MRVSILFITQCRINSYKSRCRNCTGSYFLQVAKRAVNIYNIAIVYEGAMIMVKRITLAIVGIVCLLWTFLPDPVPFVIDDVIAALGGAGSILAFIKSFSSDDNKK